ncbi:UNVERIFIED_CONTAM: hypothetical protein Slati_1406000 [Sesamum latifolium]|uniref:Reverse transcriptase domain-containing protein n=1 Tax=Sesamum latifolium TaxID=2727402 RepID=A0AAW2X8M6_9LAMI
MLQQRAKLRWMKEEDQCSRIFFRKINARRASQRIYQIQNAERNLLTDFNLVVNEFVEYFSRLFGGTRREGFISLDFLQQYTKHLITEEDVALISTPVMRNEVRDANFDIDEDSAPGPDGFSSGFFKAAWPIVGEDVTKAILEFFQNGWIVRQVNTTLITLIPKVNIPSKVTDFRPISCCNVIYKAITKIMVKRMQAVLEKLIDTTQNVFVPGRSISDNILLAQELLSGYKQKRLPPRCTIKVDLQKAYDSVEWNYLMVVLRLFKFPLPFINLVDQCISTASCSISLNSGIHGFFPSTRGLRQDDPISPYMFVLVMESFHLLLKWKINNEGSFKFH